MWFSFDGESFWIHQTEEEARESAADSLDDYRDTAMSVDGEWPSEVEEIYWGKVMGRTVKHETGHCNDQDGECEFRLEDMGESA